MDWDKKKEFLMARIYQTGRVKKTNILKIFHTKILKT